MQVKYLKLHCASSFYGYMWILPVSLPVPGAEQNTVLSDSSPCSIPASADGLGGMERWWRGRGVEILEPTPMASTAG